MPTLPGGGTCMHGSRSGQRAQRTCARAWHAQSTASAALAQGAGCTAYSTAGPPASVVAGRARSVRLCAQVKGRARAGEGGAQEADSLCMQGILAWSDPGDSAALPAWALAWWC